jgi:hypothetical protein
VTMPHENKESQQGESKEAPVEVKPQDNEVEQSASVEADDHKAE